MSELDPKEPFLSPEQKSKPVDIRIWLALMAVPLGFFALDAAYSAVRDAFFPQEEVFAIEDQNTIDCENIPRGNRNLAERCLARR